jgi:EAL domain-containing protein (putative c-di-GMP-specific phosphodiesterase class I)
VTREVLFPTTLVGSYPQPEWLIDRAQLAGRFPPRVRAKELWRVPEAFLAEAQDDATIMAIKAQEEAGLDIVTDGEIRRESYSNRFATALEGVDIDNPGSALDRSGHPNPVPRVVGKIRRRHPVEVEDLLQHADMAMYRAKQKGRGTHVFFEEGMNREAQRRLALDRELRRALEEEQFVLHYQPQLDLRANRIVGAEALLRWVHPERGLVATGPFISFAEETGLIERIGEWVLDAACAQFTAWRAEGLGIDHVSVNVSPRQFRRRDFPDMVARALERHRVPPQCLRLEITESVLVDDSGAADATLARLCELGTPLELDDFGTGYSSLAYLQRLPVATIKLDRSFIRGIAANDDSQAIVRAAIAMVHALNKQVVAEGVETAEQLRLLREWNCDAIQGYYLSKPLPAGDFARRVHAPPAEARPAA